MTRHSNSAQPEKHASWRCAWGARNRRSSPVDLQVPEASFGRVATRVGRNHDQILSRLLKAFGNQQLSAAASFVYLRDRFRRDRRHGIGQDASGKQGVLPRSLPWLRAEVIVHLQDASILRHFRSRRDEQVRFPFDPAILTAVPTLSIDPVERHTSLVMESFVNPRALKQEGIIMEKAARDIKMIRHGEQDLPRMHSEGVDFLEIGERHLVAEGEARLAIRPPPSDTRHLSLPPR
mmetsp:Transcript_17098/g.65192  ORF Transcript_17098/g.65192 Transcript_17098/m.65192 type:complete len:235 (-) Transcript_17098:710-1414(-)